MRIVNVLEAMRQTNPKKSGGIKRPLPSPRERGGHRAGVHIHRSAREGRKGPLRCRGPPRECKGRLLPSSLSPLEPLRLAAVVNPTRERRSPSSRGRASGMARQSSGLVSWVPVLSISTNNVRRHRVSLVSSQLTVPRPPVPEGTSVSRRPLYDPPSGMSAVASPEARG